CRLPGGGVHVAMAYRFYRDRFRFKRRGLNWGIPDVAKGLRISNHSARRGLHAAELAWLLSIPGVGSEAGDLRFGPPGDGSQTEASVVVRADSLELVAPGLSAPRKVPPSWSGLLALGGLRTFGRIRAGAQLLVGVGSLPILGLSGRRYTGAGRVGLCCESA